MGALGADHVARPSLVFRPGRQVSDDHFYGLQFLILRWDGADFVGDLITGHRHVFAFDATGWGALGRENTIAHQNSRDTVLLNHTEDLISEKGQSSTVEQML